MTTNIDHYLPPLLLNHILFGSPVDTVFALVAVDTGCCSSVADVVSAGRREVAASDVYIKGGLARAGYERWYEAYRKG
jgi:hypothetical protein